MPWQGLEQFKLNRNRGNGELRWSAALCALVLTGVNNMTYYLALASPLSMMDRRSKCISMLSNIMKKISTTQDMLVQNLK